MSNLLAAIGRGQLEKIEELVSKRRLIFNRYQEALSQIEGFTFMEEAEYGKSNRWLTTLIVNEKKVGTSRSSIIDILEKENIESRPVWKPMHLQPLYQECDYVTSSNRDISAELFANGICLPSGFNLSERDQDRIINLILSLVN